MEPYTKREKEMMKEHKNRIKYITDNYEKRISMGNKWHIEERKELIKIKEREKWILVITVTTTMCLVYILAAIISGDFI